MTSHESSIDSVSAVRSKTSSVSERSNNHKEEKRIRMMAILRSEVINFHSQEDVLVLLEILRKPKDTWSFLEKKVLALALKTSDFFRNKRENLLEGETQIQLMAEEINVIIVGQGECVIKSGNKCDSVYFIVQGEAVLQWNTDQNEEQQIDVYTNKIISCKEITKEATQNMRKILWDPTGALKDKKKALALFLAKKQLIGDIEKSKKNKNNGRNNKNKMDSISVSAMKKQNKKGQNLGQDSQNIIDSSEKKIEYSWKLIEEKINKTENIQDIRQNREKQETGQRNILDYDKEQNKEQDYEEEEEARESQESLELVIKTKRKIMENHTGLIIPSGRFFKDLRENTLEIEEKILKPGEFFGENFLLSESIVSQYSVYSKTNQDENNLKTNSDNINNSPLLLISLTMRGFDRLASEGLEKVVNERVQFLSNYCFLENHTERQLVKMITDMTEITISRGQYLFKEGEDAKQIYFIFYGKVQVQLERNNSATNRYGSQNITPICEYSECSIVGERELVEKLKTRQSSCVGVSAGTELLAMNYSDFIKHLQSGYSMKLLTLHATQMKELFIKQKLIQKNKLTGYSQDYAQFHQHPQQLMPSQYTIQNQQISQQQQINMKVNGDKEKSCRNENIFASQLVSQGNVEVKNEVIKKGNYEDCCIQMNTQSLDRNNCPVNNTAQQVRELSARKNRNVSAEINQKQQLLENSKLKRRSISGIAESSQNNSFIISQNTTYFNQTPPFQEQQYQVTFKQQYHLPYDNHSNHNTPDRNLCTDRNTLITQRSIVCQSKSERMFEPEKRSTKRLNEIIGEFNDIDSSEKVHSSYLKLNEALSKRNLTDSKPLYNQQTIESVVKSSAALDELREKRKQLLKRSLIDEMVAKEKDQKQLNIETNISSQRTLSVKQSLASELCQSAQLDQFKKAVIQTKQNSHQIWMQNFKQTSTQAMKLAGKQPKTTASMDGYIEKFMKAKRDQNFKEYLQDEIETFHIRGAKRPQSQFTIASPSISSSQSQSIQLPGNSTATSIQNQWYPQEHDEAINKDKQGIKRIKNVQQGQNEDTEQLLRLLENRSGQQTKQQTPLSKINYMTLSQFSKNTQSQQQQMQPQQLISSNQDDNINVQNSIKLNSCIDLLQRFGRTAHTKSTHGLSATNKNKIPIHEQKTNNNQEALSKDCMSPFFIIPSSFSFKALKSQSRPHTALKSDSVKSKRTFTPSTSPFRSPRPPRSQLKRAVARTMTDSLRKNNTFDNNRLQLNRFQDRMETENTQPIIRIQARTTPLSKQLSIVLHQ